MAKLWTAEEVAAYWRVSPRTVLRLIHDRRIKAICVGRSYRIPDDVAKNGIVEASE
jgi:excisionase family DNA binding protein